MAVSPAHTLGQFIGDVLEAAVEPLFAEFAGRHGLYLDRKGPRAARRGRKVSWTDAAGNTHDLDYVIERGGTSDVRGVPVAFIETAWRRYTKHSRNKAQEMQGAILPLSDTYRANCPFMGVVLAGVFTEGALVQLRSLGFAVLYLPLDTVVEAFSTVGVDAYFDEDTPTGKLAKTVRAMQALSRARRQAVASMLVALNQAAIAEFMGVLERSALRRVRSIRVLPLHGEAHLSPSVSDAIGFIVGYREDVAPPHVVRYEIEVTYSNADMIDGRFAGKEDAIRFLRDFERPSPAAPSSNA